MVTNHSKLVKLTSWFDSEVLIQVHHFCLSAFCLSVTIHPHWFYVLRKQNLIKKMMIKVYKPCLFIPVLSWLSSFFPLSKSAELLSLNFFSSFFKFCTSFFSSLFSCVRSTSITLYKHIYTLPLQDFLFLISTGIFHFCVSHPLPHLPFV